MARFWYTVWDALWVFRFTYLYLLLRTLTLSSWWCQKEYIKNSVFLRQLYYGQIGFIVLVPVYLKIVEGVNRIWFSFKFRVKMNVTQFTIWRVPSSLTHWADFLELVNFLGVPPSKGLYKNLIPRSMVCNFHSIHLNYINWLSKDKLKATRFLKIGISFMYKFARPSDATGLKSSRIEVLTSYLK